MMLVVHFFFLFLICCFQISAFFHDNDTAFFIFLFITLSATVSFILFEGRGRFSANEITFFFDFRNT